jgi:SAM-dependent methyltransferase
MSYQEIKAIWSELAAARDEGRSLAPLWKEYATLVRATQDKPPLHLQTLLATLDKVRCGRDPSEVMILDHGCGGGLTLLYLLALGYTGIHGVDVGEPREMWAPLLDEVFGIDDGRFHVYSGGDLPFADESFDFIFSQQVLEHVTDRFIDTYYVEEGRVLRPGGMVFHEVPHRLYPYDSHTRTWFIHMLPKPLRRILYRLTGNDPDYVEAMLHLRMTSFHRRMLRQHIGPFTDHTLERFKRAQDLTDFDGPKKLRRMAGWLITAPIMGPIFTVIVKNAIQLDTVAVKSVSGR